MSIFKSHTFLTIFLISLGVGAIFINLLIFQKLGFDSESQNVSKVLVGIKAENSSRILPDIKKDEQVTNSKIHNKEIAKVKKSLPYSDPEGKFLIIYYERSKVFQVEVYASNIAEYRENKQIAEVVLTELGSSNVCYLAAIWAVPIVLNDQVTHEDVITNGCPG